MMQVEAAAWTTPTPLLLKLELFQHAGSFKPRGVFNRLLAAQESSGLPPAGVIGASGGNAGLALAYAAQALGVRAEVFVPEVASPVKVQRLRHLGAHVRVAGALYADAQQACLQRAHETGALLVHAYDQPEIVAGQGSLGLELLDQVGTIDTVVVAVGGGGLVGGITAALGQTTRVVAVEPERIPTLHAALLAGEPVDVEVGGIAADSLGATRIGTVAFDVVQAAGVHSVLVSDEAIIAARQRLWDDVRIAAEPGGATALAALLSGAYQPHPDERVAVIICGGNTDPSHLTQPYFGVTTLAGQDEWAGRSQPGSRGAGLVEESPGFAEQGGG